MVSLEARVDLLERSQADLLSENVALRRDLDQMKREVAAAVDQARYCIRKFDPLRAALSDQSQIGKGVAGQ